MFQFCLMSIVKLRAVIILLNFCKLKFTYNPPRTYGKHEKKTIILCLIINYYK